LPAFPGRFATKRLSDATGTMFVAVPLADHDILAKHSGCVLRCVKLAAVRRDKNAQFAPNYQ